MNEREDTVLIVDDSKTNVEMLISLLELHGFETITARSGEMGIRRAKFSRPGLILLDIMMPGINGFETCCRLKEDEETKNIPVIFMTALVDIKDKLRGFEVGGVDYITKPFEEADVLVRVKTHLALRNTQKQLRAEIAERKRSETALRLAKEAAEAADQAKNKFIANMSHELRTPLSAIIGFSELSARHPGLPDDVLKNLNIIHSSGEQLLTLINRILDLSRADAGNNMPDGKDLNLPVKANAAELGRALEGLPPVMAEQLRYALENSDMELIDRAIGDIRTCRPAAAGMLAEWVDNFQYERILNVLQEKHS